MHVVAWRESHDSATLERINRVEDGFLVVSDAERFQVPTGQAYIHWGMALGSGLTRARIVSPSLEQKRATLDFPVKQVDADTLDLPQPQLWVPRMPIALEPGENIEAQAAEETAGADIDTIVLGIGPRELPPMPQGELLPFRATGTDTLTAGSWTAVTLTMENSLPVGEYALVAMLAISANAVAVRVRQTNGRGERPGYPALAGTETTGLDYSPGVFDSVMWYEATRFLHNQIPQVEMLAQAGDTTETVYMWLVKTA